MLSKSAKQRKALREIAISNLKKDRNFFVVGLTYGWRRSWKRIAGSATYRSKVFYPVAGDGGSSGTVGSQKIHWL